MLYLSTEKWIINTCYIYTMDYYLAFNLNKIMKILDKWMELEINILRKVIMIQKDKITYLICGCYL